MKKIGLVAIFALCLAACDDGGEKKAQENLRKAEAALAEENFSEAKLQIDSIRILYPKAFEARKQGVKLMQQVDLKEQRKSLVYLDGKAGTVGFRQEQFRSGKRYGLPGNRQLFLSHPDSGKEYRSFLPARTGQ